MGCILGPLISGNSQEIFEALDAWGLFETPLGRKDHCRYTSEKEDRSQKGAYSIFGDGYFEQLPMRLDNLSRNLSNYRILSLYPYQPRTEQLGR